MKSSSRTLTVPLQALFLLSPALLAGLEPGEQINLTIRGIEPEE